MSTEISLIEEITESKWPEIYGVGKVNSFYEKVKAHISKEVPDVTTAKGRAAIASNSGKVSSSKTAVEKPGRAYLKKIKELPKSIETELREFVDLMDKLRDDTRQPLTDWEAEKAAIERKRLAEIAARELQEQVDRDHELACYEYADYLRQKEEAAKQAIIDAENAAKAQKEREELIAKEAADNARIEAEKAAAAEQQRIKIEAARQAAEAQAAIERAQREKAEAEAESLRQQQAAEQAKAKALLDAENAAKAALAKAETDKQAAIEAERKRVAAEQAAVDAEVKRREKDTANKKRVNNEILQDFMSAGLSEDCAKKAIVAIAKSQVRNVKINY